MFSSLAVIIIIIIYAVGRQRRGTTHKMPKKRNVTVSDDGHRVPKTEDLTCETQYGHKHEEPRTPRYIVHEEPQEGSVNLNGKIVRLKDLKNM